MKRTMHSVVIAVLATTSIASLYLYPKTLRPHTPLAEACSIARNMLITQADEATYFITGVSLFGDREQSGSGAWNLMHYDAEGNHINAHVPFPHGQPNLHYYDKAYPTNGRERLVTFIRHGTNVTIDKVYDEAFIRKQNTPNRLPATDPVGQPRVPHHRTSGSAYGGSNEVTKVPPGHKA